MVADFGTEVKFAARRVVVQFAVTVHSPVAKRLASLDQSDEIEH